MRASLRAFCLPAIWRFACAGASCLREARLRTDAGEDAKTMGRRKKAEEVRAEGALFDDEAGRDERPSEAADRSDADLLAFERPLWDQGFRAVAGVDEVGRGCLFGDVVAAAVILPPGLALDGVNDSKKLTEKRRERAYETILEHALAWSVARVGAETIDKINIKQASRLAMKLAVEALGVRPDYLLVDAEKVETDAPQLAVIHGDARSQSIAAASIVAKVTRDRLCRTEWDALYPE